MQSVTQRFLDALQGYHKLVTKFTYTVPGGDPTELGVKSGTVKLDTSQFVRRAADNLTLFGTQDDYEAITTPGTVLHIDHGIDFGGQIETVPVFHGELSGDAEQRVGDETIMLNASDHGNWLERVRFLTPYAPTASTLRTAAITALVQAAKPGTIVNVTASDTGTVGSQNVWSDSRVDAITSLCTDGNMDACFQPDGSFLISDLPTSAAPFSWSPIGLLEAISRKRPMDRLYNTVVVQPSTTDGSQTWPQQVAQISDTTNPRHPSKIGVVPYFWSSPTIQNAGQALTAAYTILFRVLGTTETLNLGMISNPALDGNDVIRVVTPAVNQDPANIFQHFVDGFALDLVTGSMTVDTRSQAVSTA